MFIFFFNTDEKSNELGHGVLMQLALLINIVITIDLSIFKIANRDWGRRCSNITAYIHMVPFFDKIRSKSFFY